MALAAPPPPPQQQSQQAGGAPLRRAAGGRQLLACSFNSQCCDRRASGMHVTLSSANATGPMRAWALTLRAAAAALPPLQRAPSRALYLDQRLLPVSCAAWRPRRTRGRPREGRARLRRQRRRRHSSPPTSACSALLRSMPARTTALRVRHAIPSSSREGSWRAGSDRCSTGVVQGC